MKINLAEIEAAARAATAGEWFPVYGVILVDAPGRGETDFPAVASLVECDNEEANASHIANMSPERAIALIEVVRKAKEYNIAAEEHAAIYLIGDEADLKVAAEAAGKAAAALRTALEPFSDEI